MIGILDYGSGNLFSISNALKKINFDQKFIKKVEDFDDVDILILPGVGSFKEFIEKLCETISPSDFEKAEKLAQDYIEKHKD